MLKDEIQIFFTKYVSLVLKSEHKFCQKKITTSKYSSELEVKNVN